MLISSKYDDTQDSIKGTVIITCVPRSEYEKKDIIDNFTKEDAQNLLVEWGTRTYTNGFSIDAEHVHDGIVYGGLKSACDKESGNWHLSGNGTIGLLPHVSAEMHIEADVIYDELSRSMVLDESSVKIELNYMR